MDKSLDDIIKTRPKTQRRPSRRGAKSGVTGGAHAAARAAAAAPNRGPAPAAKVVVGSPSEKIIVSNLPVDVNEQQIKELFSTTVGPLREVTLHYDANGKSKGLATVQFSRKGDGAKAHTQYHNRLIDGKRPMKIEIVMGPPPPPSLASRVAPAAAAAAMEGVQSTAPRGSGGGRGRRGARGRRGKSDRPAKTGEELDAEMEDYSKSETTATTVTAA